jgi:phosphoglycerate dehydrogenase-like enzyme
MQIVLPDYFDLSDADRTRLHSLATVTRYEDTIDDEAEIIQRIQGAELITAAWIHISDRVIRSAPGLKYIVLPAVGYDNVDLNAATAAGIQVCNCPTHNATAVAEYTIALIFALTRHIVTANTALRSGSWYPDAFKGVELSGKKLGLIGYGGIGRQVEKLAIALGMQVHHATSKTPPDQLDALIASVDILSLHLPLNAHTRHLIDRRRLSLMRRSAYLINTARGAIIDQSALLNALKENRFAGAALDVYENEPVSGTPNSEILELVQLKNVVATPHIAYNTQEMTVNLGQELLHTIAACIQGKPVNLVN